MSARINGLAPGAQVGHFRIQEVAAHGGMGVIYRAEQERPRRIVALKVISPEFADDAEFRQRFEREADMAASIEHPNVIPIYESGEHEGLLYLAMRYVDGVDLRAWLLRHGPMDPTRAAGIVMQVGDALDAAHASGLVHRDLKPGNILLAERAGRDHVYLTDFGLTKRSASKDGLTRTGTWVGTPDYVAPEQIRGEHVDARSDVYSLGCVLFQLLSGQVPFDRDSDVSTIFAHMNDNPPSLAQVAPGSLDRFDPVIQRALAKNPDDRYASAGDLGRAALSAAQRRSIAVDERSVAVGDAAPASGPSQPAQDAQADRGSARAEPAPSPDATIIDEPSAAQPPATGAAPRAEAPATPGASAAPPPVEQSQPPAGQAGAPTDRGAPPTEPPVPPPAARTEPPSPGQTPAREPGQPSRRRRLRVVLAVLGGLVVVGGIAAGVIVFALGGKSDDQLVRDTVTGYFSSSGAAGCDFLSPALISGSYTDVNGCHRSLASAQSSTLNGSQSIQLNGSTATDTGLVADGSGVTIKLVKQNGKWLIDSIDNLDSDAIQRQIQDFEHALGAQSCTFFTDGWISRQYGSLDQCRTRLRGATSIDVTSQTVNVQTGGQRATDQVQVAGGQKYKFTLEKQHDGTWLISDITKQR